MAEGNVAVTITAEFRISNATRELFIKCLDSYEDRLIDLRRAATNRFLSTTITHRIEEVRSEKQRLRDLVIE
jgi:hypothetical protein